MGSRDIIEKEISNVDDIMKLNKILLKRKAHAEICFVATELAQNIVNANTKARMHVNGQSVVSYITGDKFMEACSYIQKAKHASKSLSVTNIKNKDSAISHGYGLMTIFKAGWTIVIEPLLKGGNYKITATKLSNS